MKKMLALVLSLTLLVSMLAVPAFAATSESIESEENGESIEPRYPMTYCPNCLGPCTVQEGYQDGYSFGFCDDYPDKVHVHHVGYLVHVYDCPDCGRTTIETDELVFDDCLGQ